MTDILTTPVSTESWVELLTRSSGTAGGFDLEKLIPGFRWLYNRVMSGSGALTVADRAALTALVVADLNAALARADVADLRVTVLDDDGSGNPRTYRWDSDSAATADNDILAPDAGAGRWHAVVGDVASVSVADPTLALAAEAAEKRRLTITLKDGRGAALAKALDVELELLKPDGTTESAAAGKITMAVGEGTAVIDGAAKVIITTKADGTCQADVEDVTTGQTITYQVRAKVLGVPSIERRLACAFAA